MSPEERKRTKEALKRRGFLDEEGFPTDLLLDTVRHWRVGPGCRPGLARLFDLVRDAWFRSESVVVRRRKGIYWVILKCEGVSGNWEILEILKERLAVFWRVSTHRGIHVFAIPETWW